MWYQEPFINRRNWILENMHELECSIEQVYVLLLIDYLNEFNRTIDLQTLSKYTQLNIKTVDQLLNELITKGYVKIIPSKEKIHFDIGAVFLQHQRQPISISKDLFQLFEHEFKRPLSEKEMTQLNIWSKHHPEKMIIYALKEALIQQKVAFPYINKILENWKNEGKTLKDFDHA